MSPKINSITKMKSSNLYVRVFVIPALILNFRLQKKDSPNDEPEVFVCLCVYVCVCSPRTAKNVKFSRNQIKT